MWHPDQLGALSGLSLGSLVGCLGLRTLFVVLSASNKGFKIELWVWTMVLQTRVEAYGGSLSREKCSKGLNMLAKRAVLLQWEAVNLVLMKLGRVPRT